MKKLSVRQVAQLKRTAQNVYPLVAKKNKLQAKMAELNEELEVVNTQIDAWESATKAMTGGYTSEDLLTRSVITLEDELGNVKKDKNGNPQKTTKYEPKEGVLVFDKDSNTYTIVEPEVEQPEGEGTLAEQADGEAKAGETEVEDPNKMFNPAGSAE